MEEKEEGMGGGGREEKGKSWCEKRKQTAAEIMAVFTSTFYKLINFFLLG